MQLCPKCNRIYDDTIEETCPSCGQVPSGSEVVVEELQLSPVYRASDQTTADIIRALLESEGIAVYLDSRQVAWFDGVMTMAEGYYGDLLVPKDEEEKALEIIQAYQSAPVDDSDVIDAESATED